MDSLQSKEEEKLNVLTHGIGAIGGCIGLVMLGLHYSSNSTSVLALLIYGISVIFLFSASTLYHYASKKDLKQKLRIVDHISIYILIAGTYTPVCLSVLKDSLGHEILFAVWGITIIGLVLKLFFTGKYEKISLLLYLVMGWLIVLDFSTFVENTKPHALIYLILGGLFYTLGIVFYVMRKLKYHHVIWHVFVLFGALCHYLMIYEIVTV